MAPGTVAVALVVAGYLIGSLSGSLLIGRLRGVDIRTQGSGNAGGTNALRTQGWAFALGVVAIDVGKGALAAALPLLADVAAADRVAVAAACAFAAVLGHRYPVYFGFRGGKGAATLVGAVAVLLPLAVLPVFALWLVLVGLTGYVGLATIIGACSLPVAVALLAPSSSRAVLLAFAIVAAAFIVFTHRDNIARLRAGNEHRFARARFLARRRPPDA